MIRLAPWDVVASPLATASDDAAATRRWAASRPPERRLGFWLALWAAVIAAEFGALVPVIFPGEEQVASRAGGLPAHRRIVRGLRADRLAPATRQPQRPAHGRGGRRLLRVRAHRPVRRTARADGGDRAAGALGALLRRAAADAADRRTARIARRLAAGGRVRAGPVGPADRLAAVLRAGGQPAGRLPGRRHRRRGRQGAALAGRPRLRRRRGRGRRPMDGGVAAAPARAAAERRGQRGPAALRRAADQRPRDRLALAGRAVGRDPLARERAGGLPRRAAALAAGPRRPRGPLPRPQHDARRRPADGAGQDARRPGPRGGLSAARSRWATPTPTAGRCWCPRSPPTAPPPWSRATAARSRRSSTTPRSTTTPSWSTPSAPRRASRWRTSACTPRRRPGSPRCRPRASASSRRATPSAGAWSATCTTARSSAWSPCRCSCACSRAASRATPPTAEQLVSTASDAARPVARGAARAGARHPPRRARPRPRRGARLAGRALAGADHRLLRRPTAACPSRSSSRPTSWPPRRWPTSPSTPQATSVTVRVSHTGASAIIEIADDGVGGADEAGGSGLRGLADRVEALDGRLRVVSPAGAGTTVTAELPCG